jgi:hypothetical protein
LTQRGFVPGAWNSRDLQGRRMGFTGAQSHRRRPQGLAAATDVSAHRIGVHWHPAGRRTTLQKNGLRSDEGSAEQHLGCAREWQACSASAGFGHAANRRSGAPLALDVAWARMRISDLLSHPGSIVPESSVWTACPVCGRTQQMDKVPVSETPIRVVYECDHGCGPILTLTFAPPDGTPAIHMRDWAVENPSALFCRPITGDQESIRFPPTI